MNHIAWQERKATAVGKLGPPYLVKDKIQGYEPNDPIPDEDYINGLCDWDTKEYKLAARGIDATRFMDCTHIKRQRVCIL